MPVRVTNLCDNVWWVHVDPPALGSAQWHLSKTLNKGKKLFGSLIYIHRDDKSSSVQVLACEHVRWREVGVYCMKRSLSELWGRTSLSHQQQVPGDPGAEQCSQTPVAEHQNRRSQQPTCAHATILSIVWRERDVRMTPSTFKINSIQCSHHFSYCPTFRPIRQDLLSYIILVTSTTHNILVLMVVLHEKNLMEPTRFLFWLSD